MTADRFIEERVNTEGPRITLGKVGGGTLTRKQSGPLVSSLVRRQNEVSHGANKLARFSSVTWSPGVAARKLKLSRLFRYYLDSGRQLLMLHTFRQT